MGEPNDLIRGVYTTLLTYVFSFQQEIVLDQSWLYVVHGHFINRANISVCTCFHPIYRNIYGNNSIIIISFKISSKYKYKYTYAKDRKILSNFLPLQDGITLIFLSNSKHDYIKYPLLSFHRNSRIKDP